jgi:hypothetical protein
LRDNAAILAPNTVDIQTYQLDSWTKIMANLNKFDPRLDSLVVETRTLWDPSVGNLGEEDRRWLAASLHEHPELAAKVQYERAHTGFTREITVTVADIERLYQERLNAR